MVINQLLVYDIDKINLDKENKFFVIKSKSATCLCFKSLKYRQCLDTSLCQELHELFTTQS